MFTLASNPLVYSAASTVGRKAFQVVLRSAIKGMSTAVVERFQQVPEVLRLRDELELKVRVLSLPIDVCVQQAVRGNTVLQGAVDVALRVLADIEGFEAALRGRDVSAARNEAPDTPDWASPAAAAKKLRTLIGQLDSLLPYLGVAISAVGLLDAGAQRQVSPSRLLAASWYIRSAGPQPGELVYSIAQAAWHKEGMLSVTAGSMASRPMQNEFPLCSVQVARRSAAEPDPESSSSHSSSDESKQSTCTFLYDLLVAQDLDDGTYHEDDEAPGEVQLAVEDVTDIQWATTQSLKLGDNEFSPALILLTAAASPAPSLLLPGGRSAGKPSGLVTPPAGVAARAVARASSRLGSAGANSSKRGSSTLATPQQQGLTTRFAIQCCGSADAGAGSSEEWRVLSELEYVLRLCMLEAREETPHTQVEDERIYMAFLALDVNTTSSVHIHQSHAVSRMAATGGTQTPAAKSPQGCGDGAELSDVAKGFQQLGFGSPVVPNTS